MSILVGLRTFASNLDGPGIPWFVFKGPVLSEGYDARPDLRYYYDLDLLVPCAAFRSSSHQLGRAGIDVRDRNWRLIAEDTIWAWLRQRISWHAPAASANHAARGILREPKRAEGYEVYLRSVDDAGR